jgi:hypothetical protein
MNMTELPLAVRIAAGLAATAVERARRLPQDLAELPVTAVSQAMQVSMRVQQRITDLAIKGDNAIAQLRSPAEEPPWAVFDEDLDEGVYRPPTDRPAPAETAEPDDRAPLADLVHEWYEAEFVEEFGDGEAPEIVVEPLEPVDDLDDTVDLAVDPDNTSDNTPDNVAENGARGSAAGLSGLGGETAGTDETADTVARNAGHTGTEPRTRGSGTADTPGVGPGVLPGYPGLSLASVRARLRTFDAAGLQELLDYEVAHENRPEFVRMLTNRIGTVRDR